MDKNRDDIIRKLFERSLEPKERGELNNYEFINDALRKQWEEAPAIVDSVREERILHISWMLKERLIISLTLSIDME